MKRRDLLKLAPTVLSMYSPLFHAAAAAAGVEEKSDIHARDEAVAIIRNARAVVTPHGITRLEAIEIGGIRQWISVRGDDRRNPVLLYVHGGPGYVSMPTSWWFGHGWEDYFTVVHWDQRGAGKTYLLNNPAAVKPTLTVSRAQADLEEVVSWLRAQLGKDRIFVLGHSWGSFLGLDLATKRPDWLHAYIGVGQVIDTPESERRGWASTMEAARKDSNTQAIHDLESIAPYFSEGKHSTLADVFVQRKWLDYYGGEMCFRHGNSAETDLARLSPDYSDDDIPHIWDGNKFSEESLLLALFSLNLTHIRELHCPVLLFEGRHDANVNSQVAAEWFERVRAPYKKLIWFENSAHLPMSEEPGKFLVSLASYAHPLARSAR